MLFLLYSAWFSKKRINSSSYSISPSGTNTEETLPCNLNNGKYTATIDYYNPTSGVEASYSSDVTVENCTVIKIYYNKEGKHESTDLPKGELENDRSTKMEDEDGGIYTVQIH